MADDFALGNALMTFGQTGGNAVNQYFNEQIGAAERAQETTLKMLQMKGEQDYKQQQLTETGRAHDLEHADRQANAQSEDLYRKGELSNAQQRNANEAKYQQGELGIRGGELENQRANTSSEIEHRGVEERQNDEKIQIDRQKAATAAANNKGEGVALKAGQEHYQRQLTQIDEQIKKLNPDNSTVLTDDAQKKIDTLTKQRGELQRAMNSNLADQSRIGKFEAPETGDELLPQDAGSQAFGEAIGAAQKNPRPVATGPSGAAKATKIKPSVDISAIPPGAAQMLKSNPSLRGQFDQKYGSGAAEQVLGE